MKNRFASPIIGSMLILPSIEERLPLVTRARMLCTVFGPQKVADCGIVQIKLAKALEEIAAPLRSKAGGDHKVGHVVGVGKWRQTSLTKTAIEHYAGQKRVSQKRQQCNYAWPEQVKPLIHGRLFLCKTIAPSGDKIRRDDEPPIVTLVTINIASSHYTRIF